MSAVDDPGALAEPLRPRDAPTSRLLRALLDSVAGDEHRVERLVCGPKWILSLVADPDGRRRAGLAFASATCCTADGDASSEPSRTSNGPSVPDSALACAEGVLGDDPLAIACGLATLNALVAAPSAQLAPLDAAEWLFERAPGRHVAVVGRFPFADAELRRRARELWVFERTPAEGEHGEVDIPRLLPGADVVAITASTLLDRSLDRILAAVRPGAEVMLLGPSTPLSPLVFELGIDIASGVEVLDPDAAAEDVAAGRGFRRLRRLRRASLLREWTGVRHTPSA